MKPRAPRSFEEMLQAPEGEWHELRGGVEIEVADDSVEADAQHITVSLPAHAIRAFRPKPRERLSARVAGGTLIVKRSRAPPARRRADRVR